VLRSISSNDERFRTIYFREGFNVVLADRDPAATDQQSRNARGKTSVLLVLNYVLGGNLHENLKPLADQGWEFTLTLDLLNEKVSVTRSLASGSRLRMSFPPALAGVLAPYLKEGSIALEDWKDLLGLTLFRLESSTDEAKESLSVRTLLSYVVRSNPPTDPLKFFPGQPAISVRKHISFLLGLDWNIVRELQVVNRQLDDLQAVARTVRDGVLDNLRPTGELELERSAAQNAVDELTARVGKFRVLEDPENMVRRADNLTEVIAKKRDQAFVDQRMETLFRSALADDPPAENLRESQVVDAYEAAGAIFNVESLRRLESVEAFRRNLLSNRMQFLEAELSAVRQRLAAVGAELRVLDLQRESLMGQLQAGGALDELIAMQSELAGLVAKVTILNSQIEQTREISVTVDLLKLEKASLRKDASTKLAEDRGKVDEISDRFRAKMKRLYDVDAAISIGVDDDGYQFAVKVPSGASSAVSRMKLFCFDLTLLEEGVATGHHPDFLVHDSSVFDGVDPRQRASALKYANSIATTLGGQYICTLNSNDVPDDVAGEAWYTEGIVRTVLDTDDGGLFGVRF
jgi:uncharacterized protein YydD (DUF2326 family)